MTRIIDRLAWVCAGALGIALIGTLAGLVNAGPLDPPGTPASTRPVVEPRIPLGPAGDPSTLTVNVPGSYFLTDAFVAPTDSTAILITASDVALDLMGFQVTAKSCSLATVPLVSIAANVKNVTIHNGVLRDACGDGIRLAGNASAQITNVRVIGSARDGLRGDTGSSFQVHDSQFVDNAGNGVVSGGDDAAVMTNVEAARNGLDGINIARGTLTSCFVHDNAGNGIQIGGLGTIIGCQSQGNTGAGFRARGTLKDCVALSNAGHGIVVGESTHVTGCTVGYNTGDGIRVESGSAIIIDNQVRHTGAAAGIRLFTVSASDNRIEGNNVTSSGVGGIGIDIDTAGNFIVRNTVAGSTTPYSIIAGNSVGPIVAGTDPIASTNPWANFTY